MGTLRSTLATLLAVSCTLAVPAFAEQSSGAASWYGPGFQGRQTANGETFDQNA
jgi:rare lipoprotein A